MILDRLKYIEYSRIIRDKIKLETTMLKNLHDKLKSYERDDQLVSSK